MPVFVALCSSSLSVAFEIGMIQARCFARSLLLLDRDIDEQVRVYDHLVCNRIMPSRWC